MQVNRIPLMLGAALALGHAQEDVPAAAEKPFSIAAIEEFGMLKSGRFGGKTQTFENEWMDNFGAFFTKEGPLDERFSYRIGLGGLFQFQKPEVINPNWGGTQYKNFFFGPTIADLTYAAPMANGTFTFGGGLFPYKYNPDAANLGEYLFRTGPYPTFVLSGAYSYVGNSQAYLQGMKTGWKGGNFSADLLFLTETTLPPLYDFSLAAVAKYRVGGGLLDLMAGANMKRLLPVHPSRTTRETVNNAYFQKGGQYYTGKISYYQEQANFYDRLRQSADSAGDAALSARYAGLNSHYKGLTDSVSAWTSPSNPVQPDYQHYTQSGVILMGGFSLDIKKALPMGALGPADLRLYAEAALLGVKDYPIFYEKKAERLPIMVGFNLPAFRLLDLLSVQVEYLNSPWINSYEESGQTNEATPFIPRGNDRIYSESEYKDITGKDNYSWSILARRTLVPGLALTGQVARDHIRAVSEAAWVGPGTDPNELLITSKDWYWMLQFSIGI